MNAEQAQEDAGFEAFIKGEAVGGRIVALRPLYVDMAGDLVAGLLLSQIVYWYTPDETGRSRLRVERDGEPCLVKARTEWWDECRVTPKQADLALKKLRAAGLVRTRTCKYHGAPTTHIWLDKAQFMARRQAVIDAHFAAGPDAAPDLPQSGNSPKGEIDIDERGKSISPKGEKPSSPKGENDLPQIGNSISPKGRELPNRDYDIEDNIDKRAGGARAAPPRDRPVAVQDTSGSEPESPPARRRRRHADAPGGGRERDPLLDHHAMQTYREIVHYHVPIGVRALVAERVPDTELARKRWREVVLDWMATSGNPRNITGMLDCFSEGKLLSEKYKARSRAGVNGDGAPSYRNGVFTLPGGAQFVLPGDNTWTGDDAQTPEEAPPEDAVPTALQEGGDDADRR